MITAPGLLQQVSVYSTTDGGSDGWATSQYTLLGVWYASLVPGPSRRRYATPNGDIQADAMLYLDARQPFPLTGLVQGADGTIWTVLHAHVLQLTRQWEVALVRSLDQNIVLGAVATLPPVRVPSFGLRADQMSNAFMGLDAVGKTFYRLGSDPTAKSSATPSFDSSTGIRTMVLGTRGRVTVVPNVDNTPNIIQQVLADPTGFTLIVAMEPSFATELNLANNYQVATLQSVNIFTATAVTAYVATAGPRMTVRSKTGQLFNVLSSTNLAPGRRVVGYEFDPTQNVHFDKFNFYIDGVLCNKFANASTGVSTGLAESDGCDYAWGHIPGAAASGPPIQRQFAMYLWPGKLTAQDHADVAAWLRAAGWV